MCVRAPAHGGQVWADGHGGPVLRGDRPHELSDSASVRHVVQPAGRRRPAAALVRARRVRPAGIRWGSGGRERRRGGDEERGRQRGAVCVFHSPTPSLPHSLSSSRHRRPVVAVRADAAGGRRRPLRAGALVGRTFARARSSLRNPHAESRNPCPLRSLTLPARQKRRARRRRARAASPVPAGDTGGTFPACPGRR